MTESTIATCQYSGCGKPIEQKGGRGHRPKVFCSDRCRQRHHREEEERLRLEAMAALERENKELQEQLNVEERFRTDTRKRDFKIWLRSHPQPTDTTFFRRFLDDREMPSSGSRSLYEAKLHLHNLHNRREDGYSEEDMLLFRDAWKRMLFQS